MIARRWKTLWLLSKRTVGQFSADNCPQLAAAISYYVLFSIVPLLILLVSVFGFVVRDNDIQQEVIDQVMEATPLEQREGENLVSDTLQGVSRVSGALTIVGVLGMAWSSSAMFGAVRRGLNTVWKADMPRPIVQQKLIDLAMMAGLGLLLAASIAGTTGLRIIRELSDEALGPLSTGTSIFWSLLPFVLPGVISLAVFVLIYRYVPNAPNRLGDLWPGALLATVLFETMKNGFALYVAKFNNYDLIYGSLGAAMLFLLWTYLTANILLLGAELSYQYGRLVNGEYAEALAAPGAPIREELRRFVRGLFLREREEPAPDVKAKG
jgi:membrane protein